MNNYEINIETLAIFPYGKKKSKIIEMKREIIVDCSPINIINNSCKFFGSSYKGRLYGTKNIIGIDYKSPILIEESKKVIFFPTKSPRVLSCAWISSNNIQSYEKITKGTEIKFYGGKKIKIELSYGIFDNQVLRATHLESALNKRIDLLYKKV